MCKNLMRKTGYEAKKFDGKFFRKKPDEFLDFKGQAIKMFWNSVEF